MCVMYMHNYAYIIKTSSRYKITITKNLRLNKVKVRLSLNLVKLNVIISLIFKDLRI